MIQGTTVKLLNKIQTGVDAFNKPIYAEIEEAVDDVLIGEPSTDDVTSTYSLYGKTVSYVLGIPKGDTHTWTGARVKFFGETFHTIGFPVEGIEANIPLRWNKKVKVEKYG